MGRLFLILTVIVLSRSECSFRMCLFKCYEFLFYFNYTSVILFICNCIMCHSNKLESVFECEVSRLLYDEGEVEYRKYEPVDLTEESATKAATGSTMKGEELCHLSSVRIRFNIIFTHTYTSSIQGFLPILNATIIGLRGSLLNESFAKNCSTLCLASSYIIK